MRRFQDVQCATRYFCLRGSLVLASSLYRAIVSQKSVFVFAKFLLCTERETEAN